MQLSCQNQYRAIAVGAAEPREVNLEDLGIGVEMEILYWQIHPGFKYHVEPCEKIVQEYLVALRKLRL